MKIKQMWTLVSDALKGVEHDYTKININKAVILLAIPMVLELFMESIFALVDMYFVGGLGKSAIAAVGLTESFLALVYSVAIGLSTAATAIVSRRVGEKDFLAASKAAAQCIVVGSIIGIIFSISGVFFARDVLVLMGADQEVIQIGTGYARILLGSNVIILLLFMINGIFRGAGQPVISMRSLWIANLFNIFLCPFFIYTLGFGLIGAAYATLIGRSIGVIYQLWFMWFKGGNLNIKKIYYHPNFKIILHIIKIAWPATFQFIIASASWVFITSIVAHVGGTSASAGYQIAIRNMVFFILPAWGLSNAAATLVGQNLGANNKLRAKQSVLITIRWNMIFMGMVMLLFTIFPRSIVGYFTIDQDVLNEGIIALRVVGSGFLFYGIGMVLLQAFNGAGDTSTPTWINFLCFWVIEIPLAYLLAYGFEFGWKGAIIAIPISETILSCIGFIIFRKGKWLTTKV